MMSIKLAPLAWQADDNGNTTPVSATFGDVYFSRADGLAESRYVFIEQNRLAERLAGLADFACFVIGEIGFGTGLNVLATWRLWQQVRPNNHSRLHIITTEKFPLRREDLATALACWSELGDLSEQLLANYPPPIAGCHRLNFFAERLTLDIWLGDATDSLRQVTGQACVQAWFLDGFAPSVNPELWSDALFAQIRRLSAVGTTFATFSVAKLVKDGLRGQGFVLCKQKGFGKKREMLTGVLPDLATPAGVCRPPLFNQLSFRFNKKIKPLWVTLPFTLGFEGRRRQARQSQSWQLPAFRPPKKPLHIAVIGAGVAGLTVAYALAMRGHRVTLLDKIAPLAGASGNVRAFVAPKLTRSERLGENLHAIGFLASGRFYPALAQASGLPLWQKTGCVDLLTHNRLTLPDVADFDPNFAQVLSSEQACDLLGTPVGEAVYLPAAGLVDTAQFAKAILAHPLISLCQGTLRSIVQVGEQVALAVNDTIWHADHAVLCTARTVPDFLPSLKPFRFSRGQISWFALPAAIANTVASLPSLKYGSYFATFEQNSRRYALLGASFGRGVTDTSVQRDDHRQNRDDLLAALPAFGEKLGLHPTDDAFAHWQGRASLRAQTPDYLPLVGQVWQAAYTTTSRIWTFAALGSKGYAYAPICAELLAGLMVGEMLPLPVSWLEKLSPNRAVLQQS